jgi:hypothetical protein
LAPSPPWVSADQLPSGSFPLTDIKQPTEVRLGVPRARDFRHHVLLITSLITPLDPNCIPFRIPPPSLAETIPTWLQEHTLFARLLEAADGVIAQVLQRAEAGWFSPRSWNDWQQKLGLARSGAVPPLPQRHFGGCDGNHHAAD